MAVNLLTSYAKQLDSKLYKESFTRNHAKAEVKFIDVNAGIIEVLTPLSQELSDYDITNNSDRYGGIQEMEDLKSTYQVQNDKSFKIGLDKGNEKDQGNLKQAGKMLSLQLREQVAPANDKIYFTKVAAAAASTGQTVTLNTSAAYDNVLDLGVSLDEATVPETGRILYVTPSFYKLIKKEIVTTMNTDKTGDKVLTKGTVGTLDDFTVIKVPTSYFPANVKAEAVWEGAIANAPVISEARVITDSENISGSLLIGRSKFDTFVLEAKKKAVATITAA